ESPLIHGAPPQNCVAESGSTVPSEIRPHEWSRDESKRGARRTPRSQRCYTPELATLKGRPFGCNRSRRFCSLLCGLWQANSQISKRMGGQCTTKAFMISQTASLIGRLFFERWERKTGAPGQRCCHRPVCRTHRT